jgi:hypothetical protein
VGLGNAYSALASGAEALSWNPAGVDNIRAMQAHVSHLGYVEGINVDTLQLAWPIYGLGGWGFGFDYLYANDQSYDNWGNPGPEFSLFDFSAQVGLSLELPWDMHLGGAYRILRQGYEAQFSMGSSFDVGWQWKGLFKRLDLGLVAANLGTPVALGQGFGPLPLSFRSGAVLRLTERWLLSVEHDHQPADHFNKLGLGSEIGVPIGAFTLLARGGYHFGPQQDLGPLSGLAVGGGLALGKWQMDYAWQPLGDLGSTHRLSLTYSSWMR